MKTGKITRKEHRFLDSLLSYDVTKGSPRGVGQKTIKRCIDLGWVEGRVERDGGPTRAYRLTIVGDGILATVGPYIH